MMRPDILEGYVEDVLDYIDDVCDEIEGGGEVLAEGGGAVLAEGGGEVLVEGGGEVLAEGSGEVVAEGGGEVLAEGSGEVVADGGGEVLAGVEDAGSDGRPLWPGHPTPCSITLCGDHMYASHSTFMRHWGHKHEEFIELWRCPNCSKTSARKTNISHHQKASHKMSFSLSPSLELNQAYISPGNVLPFKPDIGAQQQRKRKRIAAEAGARLANTHTGKQVVCRDEVATVEQGQLFIHRKPKWQRIQQ